MTDHVFIFGGPRNGSWHYQYARCAADPNLYSGTEDLDWSGSNTRKFGETIHTGTTFRQSQNEIEKGLWIEEYTKPGVLFEIAFLQSPAQFIHNIDHVESYGKKLICKGYEHSYGMGEIVDHEKVYIKRPFADQWRSFALCHILKKWQWEENDEVPESEIVMGDTDKKYVIDAFSSRMNVVYNFYSLHKDISDFNVIDFGDVVSMTSNSPLKPTPKLKLSAGVQEFISDMTPFQENLELEEKLF